MIARSPSIGLPGLYSLRIMRGLSRYDIADALGLSYHTIYGWESGKNSPTLRNLVKLCRLFHTTPNDLLGFTEGAGRDGSPVWLREAEALVAASLH